MPESPTDLADIVGQLIGREVSSATFIPLDDEALVKAVESLTRLRHEVERCQAIAAAEVARRSSTRFGVRGLAQRTGHASTGDLLQSITRSTKRETAALVGVGQMIADTDAAAELERARRADPVIAETVAEAAPPWFAELGAAVAEGVLTVEVAGAIRRAWVSPAAMPTRRCSPRPCRPWSWSASRCMPTQPAEPRDRRATASTRPASRLAPNGNGTISSGDSG
jgi:hypothetical protein